MEDGFDSSLSRLNPFAELLGLKFTHFGEGDSQCVLEINERLLNPNGVLHGGVVYSMADTGMGGALHSLLSRDERCATIEIQIVYLKAVTAGFLTCDTRVIHKGKRTAVLESEVRNGDHIVAKSLGTFSIMATRTPRPGNG